MIDQIRNINTTSTQNKLSLLDASPVEILWALGPRGLIDS